MIDASIALLKCVIDYGLCIWAFSWFAKRKSENRALFLGSIFLSSLFLFGINMLEIPWLNTIVSAFTLLVLFLVVFYTRWQQALPLALILVTLCVICEFTPPLIMSALIGNNLAQTIEITIDAAAFNLIASGIFYIVLRVGRFILNRIYGEKTPIYTKNNGWASIFPIVSIVFVYYIVYMGAVANTSQTTMMGGILYAFILISNICFFLGEVATEKRYLTAEEYKQMMFEQEKTEAVMNLQEQHLKEMKGLIHDFEAQLNGLQLLARENKSEAFKKSIEEVRESIQERNDFYFVESKALQLILNQTNELCIKYGIEFCADIRYGNFLFMTFPDVFSLFENALCNAVNACLQLGEEEKKRIELRVFRQHEQIVVLLANTYNKANTRSNTYGVELSGGQWKRIALYRTLHKKDVDLIVLDEPTANLDPKISENIINRLLKPNYNKTVIVITHDFELAKKFDRIIGMKEGKIICDSPPQAFAWELFEKHNSDKRSLPQIG